MYAYRKYFVKPKLKKLEDSNENVLKPKNISSKQTKEMEKNGIVNHGESLKNGVHLRKHEH